MENKKYFDGATLLKEHLHIAKENSKTNINSIANQGMIKMFRFF